MRLLVPLAFAALASGCVGPNPLDPDRLYVQNSTDAPLTATVVIRQDNETRWEGEVEVAAGAFERRDIFRGSGDYDIEVRLSDGRTTSAAFSLAAGPEFVQVFVRPDAIQVATMHGD